MAFIHDVRGVGVEVLATGFAFHKMNAVESLPPLVGII